MNTNEFSVTSYNHDGVLLNVSGERDEDECFITRVTAVDSSVDLFDLLPVNVLTLMALRIDAQLSREAREHNAEARAWMAPHKRHRARMDEMSDSLTAVF